MKFHETPIEGAFVIQPEPRRDERGFFARLFCSREFAAAGLVSNFVQINNSVTELRGTVRGMHCQLPPAAEIKVVRCVRGAMFDVIADLRPDSPSFGHWFGSELTGENRSMMYAPKGCAHGFQTLSDDVETLYLVGAPYTPELERGFAFDDPAIGIQWPIRASQTSPRDRALPRFDAADPELQRLRGLRSCAF